MASPFAKYQSEQVQQIAPGFIEGFAKGGASIGQGIATIGAGVGKYMDDAEKRKIEDAKTQGAINPYLRTEVENVNRSVENGFLQVGKDGKVSIVAGQEKNLDPNKIGRAIDMYNQTDGGKKKLESADLAGLVSTIQSYDALEKQAADKAKAARDAKIAELDYTSKVLGSAATLSEGISAFAQQRTQLGIAAGMQGDTAGAAVAIAEGRALTDKAMQIRLSAMKDAGINVEAFLPSAPVAQPVRPAAAAVGSGASTLYTVPTDTDFTASLSRFDAMRTAGSAPTTAPAPATAPAAEPTVSTALTAGTTGAPVAAEEPEVKTWGDAAFIVGESEQLSRYRGERMAGMTPAEYVADWKASQAIKSGAAPETTATVTPEAKASTTVAPAATETTTPAPAAVTPAPAPAAVAPAPAAKPTARQLMTGQMPAAAPAPAPVAPGQTPVAVQTPARGVTPNAAVAQAEAEIKSLQTAKSIYIEQNEAFKKTAALAGWMPDQVTSFRKLAEAAFKMTLDIDDQITKKMTLISTEKSSVATARTSEVKLSLDVTKAIEDIAPSFGGGWGSKKYWHILQNFPDEPARGLADIRVGGFQGTKSEVIDILGSRSSFMDATMSIENALDERLEKGGVGLFDLLTLDKGDYAAYTAGNVGEKILLASMRKAIVSGGNFSDADRGFVLEAIAAINNLDPRKREPYLKQLNKTMAEMVIGLYDRKLAANGVERRLDLLTEDERKAAVPATESAFMERFGIDDKGKASSSRSALQALIGEQRGTGKFGSARASAASALDKFVADAKKEAADAAEKAKKTK